ncbi:MAG: AgmX/PglI C-terminal domain-containing protein [Myxococcota bacterium]
MRVQRLILVGLLIGCIGCTEEAESEEVAPREAAPVEANEAPTFPEWAEVQLNQTGEYTEDGYTHGWTLTWPEATDDHGLEAYVILRDGEELARIEPDREGYDLGDVPEGGHHYTVIARDEGALEASLDFVLPATTSARVELASRGTRGPPGSLRNGSGPRPGSLREATGPGKRLGSGVRTFDPNSVPERVPGRVTIGEASVVGGSFRPSAVTSFLHRRAVSLNACYERLLRDNPQLSGTVKARLTVTPRGSITDITLVEGERGLYQCVQRVLRTMRFNPAPEENSTFEYPITFERAPADP